MNMKTGVAPPRATAGAVKTSHDARVQRMVSVPSSQTGIECKSNIMYDKTSEVETLTGRALSHVEVKISLSGSVITPHWFWNDYIDRQTIPQQAAADLMMVETSTEPRLELPNAMSTHSKLCLLQNTDTQLGPRHTDTDVINLNQGVKDKSVLNIMDISRQRKHVPALAPISKATLNTLNQQKLNIRPRRHTARVLHDYEVFWQPFHRDHTVAYELVHELKPAQHISSVELLVHAIRRFWLENLEIQIETKFFYVDRYFFTFHATHFSHCTNYTLQVPVHMVQVGILRRLYNWMIADNEDLRVDEHLVPIYMAAEFFGICQLTQQYWHLFTQRGDACIPEQNAFQAYMRARDLRNDSMMQLLMLCIRKTFLPLVASSEFLELDPNEVALLLRQDNLCVNSEDEVFFSAIRWLEYKWPRRHKFIRLLMSSVRFHHVSPWLRRSLSNMAENEVIAAVGNVPEVIAYMWNATKYCLASIIDEESHNRCPIMHKYRKRHRQERSWSFCPGLVHHHDLRCRNYRELTYETFKLLLIRLQMYGTYYANGLKYVPNKFWHSYRCCPDHRGYQAARECPRPAWYRIELDHRHFK